MQFLRTSFIPSLKFFQVKAQFSKALQKSTLTLHEDILSMQEIRLIISNNVKTAPERLFLDSIQNGHPSTQLWNQLRRKGGLRQLSSDTLITILKKMNSKNKNLSIDTNLVQINQHQTSIIVDQVHDQFLSLFKSRLSELTLTQIATILKIYAQANRFNQKFFREIENEIYERVTSAEVFHVSDAEKILWSYQYCEYGSAVLYRQLANTFKIAQFEIDPIKLSEYCKLFSKSRENIQGAFGLYKITEDRLMERIQDYDFHQLIKIASSNQFQIMVNQIKFFNFKLEEKISDAFPKNENIKVSDLVKLARSTSKYIFRYNSLSLYNKIESAVLHLLQYMTTKQFCQVIWSFMRSQRGNIDLYISFEEELNKRYKILYDYYLRINMLTMRQLTLLFINSQGNDDTLDINEILLVEIKKRLQTMESINLTLQNQLVLILTGLIKTYKEIDLQKTIIQKIIKKELTLTISMKISLLKTVVNSSLNADSLNLLKFIIVQTDQKDLLEQERIIFAFVRKILSKHFTQQRNEPYQDKQILKQLFHIVLDLNPQDQNAIQMLEYLCDQQGSQMRFIFSQDHWVIISWNILVQMNVYKSVYDSRIVDQVCSGIKEMNPNMICSVNLVKYIQSLIMVCQYQKKPISYAAQKLSRILKKKQMQILENCVLLQNIEVFDEDLLNSLRDTLEKSIKSQLNDPTIQTFKYINLFEQHFMQFIPSALLVNLQEEQFKFALIPISIEHDFQELVKLEDISGDCFYTKQFKLNPEVMAQKHALKQIEWNAEFVVIEVWQTLSDEQRLDLINKIFTLTFEDDISSQEQWSQNEKQKSFSEKLQEKQRQNYAFESEQDQYVDSDDD